MCLIESTTHNHTDSTTLNYTESTTHNHTDSTTLKNLFLYFLVVVHVHYIITLCAATTLLIRPYCCCPSMDSDQITWTEGTHPS